MKKLFFIAVAALAIGACSKVQTVDIQNEINFKVANYVQTKATGSVYDNGAFGTYSWFTTTGYAPTDFMVNEEVAHVGGVWKTKNNTFYWPKTGSLEFISYSPFNGTNATADSNPAITPNTITYTGVNTAAVDVSNNPLNIDYMYADKAIASKNINVVTDGVESGYSGVPTIFHHALAKLSFNIKANFVSWTDSKTNTTTTWDVKVTSAKISGSNLFTRLNYWVVTLGGQPMVTPPELSSVEAPSEATVVCRGNVFTFQLDRAIADNGGIFLVIEASEGQSNGVSRAHDKAVAIKIIEGPDATLIDLRPEYLAKHGAFSASAPKIFLRYYYVDSNNGVKSQAMLAEVKWEADGTDSGSGNGGSQSGNGSQGGSGSQQGPETVTVEAPVISGTTPFEESTQVSISGPSGAQIHYTTDGTTPTASSNLYSAPFSLDASSTVKAIAIKDGVSSSVASKVFAKTSGGNGGGGEQDGDES